MAVKRKQFVKKGLGNNPNATRELEEDVDKQFEEGYIQRAMWWFISLHFGFRARDESRKCCWGDVGLEFGIAKEGLKTGQVKKMIKRECLILGFMRPVVTCVLLNISSTDQMNRRLLNLHSFLQLCIIDI